MTKSDYGTYIAKNGSMVGVGLVGGWRNREQAETDLCQAQFKLGVAKSRYGGFSFIFA